MSALLAEMPVKQETKKSIDEIKADFKKFMEDNWDFIEANTPFNPTISKDDEWFYEDIWDEDCARLPDFTTVEEVIAWREQNNGYY